MSEKREILVVEDDEVIQEVAKLFLNEAGFIVLQAFTVEQAQEHFEQNSNIQAILFDGYLNKGKTTNTLSLIKQIADSGFTGYMFASSSEYSMREAQMSMGCNHRCSYKPRITELVNIFADLIWPRPDHHPS